MTYQVTANVMVDPARAQGRERSSSVPSWHETVPAGFYYHREMLDASYNRDLPCSNLHL